jgi:hypothetical protein
LAQRLSGGVWLVTRDGVKMTDDHQVADITLQRSRGSRTGEGLWIYPRLIVRDSRLARWRNAHRSGAGHDADVLFNSLLINISSVNTVEVLTSGQAPTPPSEGRVTYDTFLSEMFENVLPNRELLRSPTTLLDLPDRWLWNVLPLVEWCVAMEHVELCWNLAQRCVQPNLPQRLNPFLRGLADGQAGRPVDPSNSLAALGHTMSQLGAVVGPAPSWASAQG